VFPCENWSPDPDDYFASGIHEEILSRLSRISGLRTIGRETMEWYNERLLPTRQVAQELAVGYLGECSVLKDAERNQIRLTFQLIDGNTGTQLWAQNYDEDLTARSIFDIHSNLARNIARAIGATLTPEEQTRVEAIPTTNLDAFDLYLLGRIRWANRSPETIREAIEYFEAAIALDSTFALAFSGLADAYMVLPFYDLRVEPLDVYEAAKAAATRAYGLDSNLGEIHGTLGYIAHTYEWDWQTADQHLSAALELAPSHASAHHWRANLLATLGRFDLAAQEMEYALSLDPLSNVLVWATANKLAMAGRIAEARTQYERVTRMEPVVPWALWEYAENLLRYEPFDSTGAADLFGRFTALFGYPSPDRAKAAFLARRRTPDGVAEHLSFLDDLIERTVLSRTDLLYLFAPPVPVDMFFQVLEEAVEARHFHVPYVPILISTYWSEILEDPRWEAFLSRIGNPGSAH